MEVTSRGKLTLRRGCVFVCRHRLRAVRGVIQDNRVNSMHLCEVSFNFPLHRGGSFECGGGLNKKTLLSTNKCYLGCTGCLLNSDTEVIATRTGSISNFRIRVCNSTAVIGGRNAITRVTFNVSGSCGYSVRV